jgi:hypothetical protein
MFLEAKLMYLDPGFGSMLIQALVASLAALAVGIGIFRTRIAAFFRRNKQTDENVDESNDDGSDDINEKSSNESVGENTDE